MHRRASSKRRDSCPAGFSADLDSTSGIVGRGSMNIKALKLNDLGAFLKSVVKSRLMPTVRKVWQSGPYAKMMFGLDSLAQRTVPKTQKSDEHFCVLMSPAGDGNIGDNAMLNSFLANTTGQVKVFIKLPKNPMDSALARSLMSKHGDRILLYPARSLYRAMPFFRFGHVRRFAKELNGASRFFIHGADTIDGGNASASLAGWSLCNVANERGVEAAVLGFSWRDQAPTNVGQAMKRVSQFGTLFPRDGLSYSRMVELGASEVVQAADMAFSLHDVEEPPGYIKSWIEDNESLAGGFCILNVSGLIAKKLDQRPEIKKIVDAMHARNSTVLFLPHVIRPEDSDLPSCEASFNELGTSEDLLVRELLTPEQVRWITRRAQMTVTGRMHLSILTFSNGVPVVALATAGKVEGLFDFFDLRRFVVDPQPGFGKQVADHVYTILTDRPSIVSAIDTKLDHVRQLSARNFRHEEPTH